MCVFSLVCCLWLIFEIQRRISFLAKAILHQNIKHVEKILQTWFEVVEVLEGKLHQDVHSIQSKVVNQHIFDNEYRRYCRSLELFAVGLTKLGTLVLVGAAAVLIWARLTVIYHVQAAALIFSILCVAAIVAGFALPCLANKFIPLKLAEPESEIENPV